MELLFNKDGEGSKEIKALLGFTDASIKFENLKPKLYPATDLVIELIGKPIYDSLLGIYNNSSSSTDDAEFLRRVQSVILLDGYRNYAKDNDLSHSPNGRFNQIDETQKLAWEWQIYNSDKKMERDYYVLMDNLIKYMDNNVSGWKATDAYKLTNNLFIRKASDFDDYYSIESSRLLFMKLTPGIRKAERDDIVPLIGQTIFDDLKDKLKNNSSDIDSYLVKLIEEAVAYKSLSWSIPRLSVQLFPEGLLQVADTSRLTISARKSTEKHEVLSLSEKFDKDAQIAFSRIAEYIHKKNALPSEPPTLYERNFDCNDTFVDL